MGTIPLPALDIRPPQPNDALGSFEKIMALRSMANQQQLQQQQIQSQQQEQALRQQQITDQQATTAAMKNWDGKDYDALSKSVLENGGSANAATAIQQHGLGIKKTVSDIAKQDAETGSKNLDTFIKSHEAIGSQLKGLEGLPDDQIHQGTVNAIGELSKAGVFPAEQAQTMVQQVQQTADPNVLRQHLDILAKASMGAKAAAEQAKTEQETQTSRAQQGKAEQEAKSEQLKQKFYADHPQLGAPGVPAESVEMLDFLRKNPGKTPSDYVVWKAQHSPTMLVQGGGGFGQGGAGDPMVDMVGQGRIDLSTAMQRMAPVAKQSFLKALSDKYPQYNQAQYGTQAAVQKEFTSGDAAKNLTAFNTAIQHAQQLQTAADALENEDMRTLNKVGNALGYEFGSDKKTNFEVIKNALSGEISKVFKGGQATDAEIKEVQGPFNAANSPAQLKGAINNAIHLMNSKRDALKQQYEMGKQGQPNFGGSNAEPQQSLIYARDPQGKLHSAPAGTALPAGWKQEQHQ